MNNLLNRFCLKFVLTIAMFLFLVNLSAQKVKIKITYRKYNVQCVFCNKAKIYVDGVTSATALNYLPANKKFRINKYSKSTAALIFSENIPVVCDDCRDDNIGDRWEIYRCNSANNARSDKKHDIVSKNSIYTNVVEVNKLELDRIIIRYGKIQDSLLFVIKRDSLEYLQQELKAKQRREHEDSLNKAKEFQKDSLNKAKEFQRQILKNIIFQKILFCDSLYQSGIETKDFNTKFASASSVFKVLMDSLLNYNYRYKYYNADDAKIYVKFGWFNKLMQMAFFVNDFSFIREFSAVYKEQSRSEDWWISSDEPSIGYKLKFYDAMDCLLSQNFTGMRKSELKNKIYKCIPGFVFQTRDLYPNSVITYTEFTFFGSGEEIQHLKDVFKYLKTAEAYKETFAKNNTYAVFDVALEVLEKK